MTDIDDRIRGALDTDDRAFLDSLDDNRGMFQQIGDSMHGPLGNWARFGFALAIVIGLVLANALFRAFTAGSSDAMLDWGLVTIGLLIMQGFLKQWMFSRMNLLMVLREIRRLQVQAALIEETRRAQRPNERVSR